MNGESLLSEENVTRLIKGRIEPVRTSLGYRLALTFLAVAMLALPVTYVMLIAALSLGVFLYATAGVGILKELHGRAAFAAYIGPIFAGVMAVVFMIKPLVSRGRPPEPLVRFRREDEPMLFRFVDEICRALRAPSPREIRVDMQVNASAGFRRGMLSFFGSDLVLTVGLPLTAGIDIRQFAGILAHEFGHFAQGAAMRVQFIVATVNSWFARVVYERDGWDNWIEETIQDDDTPGVFVIVLRMTQMVIWISRRVLWVLMAIGAAISATMSRQMEFDADRYEARLAGSQTFARTVQDLRLLSLGYTMAATDYVGLLEERKRIVNFPRYTRLVADAIHPMFRTELQENYLREKTGLFDTHPSDLDRTKMAYDENAPGVCALDFPATAVFRDFEGLAQMTTRAYISGMLGRKTELSEDISVTEAIAGFNERMSCRFEEWGQLARRGTTVRR